MNSNAGTMPAYPQPYMIKTALGQDMPIPGMSKHEFLAMHIFLHHVKLIMDGPETLYELVAKDGDHPCFELSMKMADHFFTQYEKFIKDATNTGSRLTSI